MRNPLFLEHGLWTRRVQWRHILVIVHVFTLGWRFFFCYLTKHKLIVAVIKLLLYSSGWWCNNISKGSLVDLIFKCTVFKLMIVNAFDNCIVLLTLGSHFNDNLFICILGFFICMMLEHCICFTDWTLKHVRVIVLPSRAYIFGEVFPIVWTNTIQSLSCRLDVNNGLFIKL